MPQRATEANISSCRESCFCQVEIDLVLTPSHSATRAPDSLDPRLGSRHRAAAPDRWAPSVSLDQGCPGNCRTDRGFARGWIAVVNPRSNEPRLAKSLRACRRDVADMPLTLAHGRNTLTDFTVWAGAFACRTQVYDAVAIVSWGASPHMGNSDDQLPGPTWTRNWHRPIKGSMKCPSRT